MISSEGKFELHARGVPYKCLATNKGHYRNIITGVDCGSQIILFKKYYDDNGIELEKPIYDENCYEVIYD